MKVVLFCGGQGTRMRDYSEKVPKPMVKLGYRPLLWHIMKYYAHYGHKDFILCLGYKGDYIKRYFVEYEEYTSNNFILNKGAKEVKLLNSDLDDWNITFVDTGLIANIGQRLMKVRSYLDGEETFLANYTDGLTDLPLDRMISDFRRRQKIASFLAAQPTQSFHVAQFGSDGNIRGISPISDSGLWINAGYFIFRKEIFEFIAEGDDLVREPFQRLIKNKLLYGHRYKGFWTAMDTFKDKQLLDELQANGTMPWCVWEEHSLEHSGVH